MRKYIAEFIGTAVLVLFGCGSAVTANTLLGDSGQTIPLAFSTLLIAFAFGLSIVAMAYSIGNVSGCHINPAVSFGMLVAGKMEVKDFIGYVIAQFLGGIVGAGILAVAICLGVVFREAIFQKDSIFNYIVDGGWEKGVNIFAITASIMIIAVVMTGTEIVKRILKLLASVFGARGETVCRLISSFIKYVAIVAMLYYCFALFGVDTATLLASAGILSIAISLGAKDMVGDILAGLFIIFEGEFRVGDIVMIGDWRGTVLEIGVRTTKIEYGESLERVENILEKEFPTIRRHLPAITDGPFYKGVVSLGDNSVNVRILVQCEEADRIQLERDLNREMKLIFDKYDINIPFPKVVINQPVEFQKATEYEKFKARKFNEAQKQAAKDLGNEEEEDR